MGGLAGASGALYELDSSRPGVFSAWEDRRVVRSAYSGHREHPDRSIVNTQIGHSEHQNGHCARWPPPSGLRTPPSAAA